MESLDASAWFQRESGVAVMEDREGASAPSPLRARIADAIQSELNLRPFGPICCGDYLAGVLADAVIEELKRGNETTPPQG